MSLTIIKEGHPTLNQVAKEVQIPMTDEDKNTLTEMMYHIKKSQIPEIAEKEGLRPGVGLAAPQINVSKRMFVVFLQDFDDKVMEYAFVNPEIVEKSDAITYLPTGEGCLSVDREVEGLVMRHQEIIIKTKLFDVKEQTVRSVKMKLKGYPAIVFQHEYDHIDGILFPEKVLDIPKEGATPLWDLEEIEETA